ncbi:MAG: hypothetical protein V4736_08025, partial [Bdellovibrionota bacterium]
VPELLKKLENQGPLQMSFLIVHEWLWKFTSNPDSNRRLNYLLHSSVLEKWSTTEWENTLNLLGINNSGVIDPYDGDSCINDSKQTIKDGSEFLETDIYLRKGDVTHPKEMQTSSDSEKVFWFGDRLDVKMADNKLLFTANYGQAAIIAFQCHLFGGGKLPYCTSPAAPAAWIDMTLSVGQSCIRFHGKSAHEEFVVMIKR